MLYEKIEGKSEGLMRKGVIERVCDSEVMIVEEDVSKR